ncbi:hypothetical protein [Marinisporobacter balticus]|uniref:Lipoprotein n=1 Tax=Marinisporobacter balticus TaxID=2018667 RepID=A0A4R2KSU1_9FIRM|nr:hypothetical protein [Marinisporobacter balticus]TCO77441.1 hypothetical protein EV214_10683 [Marinisporobacter balticus]
MMKKKYNWVIPMLMVGLLFVGCTKSSEPADAVQNNTQQSTVIDNTKQDGVKNNENAKRDSPDLYGKVKKILGNEVTLELAELPERKEMSEEDREKMKVQIQNGNPGEGGFGGQGNKMKREIKFTGETKNIIIPVGLPIVSAKRGEETELELGDIIEGTFLQIWLNEDASVKAVHVIQGRE